MRKNLLRGSEGLALVTTIMMMMIMLSMTGASFFFSQLDLKASSNMKSGSGAVHAADAGVQHALAVIPGGADFAYGAGATVVSTTPFPTASSAYSYSVTATNNPPSNPNTSTAILTSTGSGPNGSNRVIKAYVGRSSGPWTPPGAIYLPGQPANIAAVFDGNSFLVTGNDTNVDGTAGSESPLPGISTTDSGTTDEITGPSGSLDSGQYGQVTGERSNPSVSTSSATVDVDQLANDLISLGMEGVDKDTLSGGPAPIRIVDLGTSASPKITHVTGNANFTCGSGHRSGLAPGSGIIIVDGDVNISGYFKFNGLIIARGANVTVRGFAEIWGGLLLKANASPGTQLTLEGNSRVRYSSQAINALLNNWGSAFPQDAKLIAWHEMMN